MNAARRRGLLIGVALGLSAALGLLVWGQRHSPAAQASTPVVQHAPRAPQSPSGAARQPVSSSPAQGGPARPPEAAPVSTPPTAPPTPVPQEVNPAPAPDAGAFAARIARMSPQERVAQQLFSYVPADLDAARALLGLGLGGIFVNRNQGPLLADYRGFLRALRGAAPGAAPLVGIDQEGGQVTRVRDPEMRFPPNAELGALETQAALARVRQQGETFGTRLREAGFSVDFAPVVDVATHARGRVIAALGRSYSSDPAEVSALGSVFALELQQAGLAPTFKHFPGHGMVAADSHVEVASTPLTPAQLAPHLAPYRALLANPKLRQDHMLIMTAHVRYPALDAANPASLSRTITTGLLRDELGYQGVVITDALGMKALSGTVYSRVRRALAAGADLALIDPGLEREVPGVVGGLVREFGDDAARWQQNAESLERIFRLKRALGLLEPSVGETP